MDLNIFERKEDPTPRESGFVGKSDATKKKGSNRRSKSKNSVSINRFIIGRAIAGTVALLFGLGVITFAVLKVIEMFISN